MDFYGNGQKTLEFVLSKYIPIGFSKPFFLLFIGKGSPIIYNYRQGFTPPAYIAVTPTEFPRTDTKSHRDSISISKATSVPAQSDT